MVITSILRKRAGHFKSFLMLNRSYTHDEMTIWTLLWFAYGMVAWEFDPVRSKYSNSLKPG